MTATGERQAVRPRQLERTRHRWRMAFDFPELGTDPRSSEEQAERWVAELDRHGLVKIGLVTGRNDDELARVVQMYPDRFVPRPPRPASPSGCRAWSAESPTP